MPINPDHNQTFKLLNPSELQPLYCPARSPLIGLQWHLLHALSHTLSMAPQMRTAWSRFRSNPNTKSLHVGKALPKIHVLSDTMFTLLYMFTTKTHAECAKPRALFLANVVGHSEDGTHPMINNTTVVVVSDQGGLDCQARTNKRIWRLSIHFGLTLLVD